MKYVTNTGNVIEVERTKCRHYRIRKANFYEQSRWVRVKKNVVKRIVNNYTPIVTLTPKGE